MSNSGLAAATAHHLISSDPVLSHARRYLQAGTPTVRSSLSYDGDSGAATLRLSQSCPATPGQPGPKQPFHMPVLVGLLDGESGAELLPTTLLELRDAEQDFVLAVPKGLGKPPVLSVFRDFSAPVISVVEGQTTDDLAFLMSHDTDSFTRFDASQTVRACFCCPLRLSATADRVL